MKFLKASAQKLTSVLLKGVEMFNRFFFQNFFYTKNYYKSHECTNILIRVSVAKKVNR